MKSQSPSRPLILKSCWSVPMVLMASDMFILRIQTFSGTYKHLFCLFICCYLYYTAEKCFTCSSCFTGNTINLTHHFSVSQILKTFQGHLTLNINIKLFRIFILRNFKTHYTRSVKHLKCGRQMAIELTPASIKNTENSDPRMHAAHFWVETLTRCAISSFHPTPPFFFPNLLSVI